MAEFTFLCPECRQAIQCDVGYRGTQINCPICQKPIVVPPAPGSGNSPAGKSKKTIFAAAGGILIVLILGAVLFWFLMPTARPAGWVAFWPADGNANGLSGKHDGELLGGATFGDGVKGQAFLLNGHGATVKIPGGSDFNLGTKASIEFWMKADPDNSMHSYQGLVTSDFWFVSLTSGYTPNIGVNFGISTDNGRSFAETANPNGGGFVVSAGVWHHVAGVYDGTKLQLYVDGKPAGKPLPHRGMISRMPPGGFVAIGSEDGRVSAPSCIGNRYFNGLIDEVGIYNRALSPGEIQNIYKAGK